MKATLPKPRVESVLWKLSIGSMHGCESPLLVCTLLAAILGVFLTPGQAQESAARAQDQNRPTDAAAESASRWRIIGVRAPDDLKVRASPGSHSPVVGSLPADAAGITRSGQPVTVGEDTWVQITRDGLNGWVNLRYLAPAEDARNPQIGAGAPDLPQSLPQQADHPKELRKATIPSSPQGPAIQVILEDRRIEAPAGHTVLSAPSRKAGVIKTVAEPTGVNTSGYVENSEGRFYVTDWSWDRWQRNQQRPNWVFIHNSARRVDPPHALTSPDSDQSKVYRESFTPPREVIFPAGFKTEDLEEHEGFQKITVMEMVDVSRPLGEYKRTVRDRYFRTSKGWIKHSVHYPPLVPEPPHPFLPPPSLPKVFSVPQAMQFPSGYAVLSDFDLGAAILEVHNGPASLTIGATIQREIEPDRQAYEPQRNYPVFYLTTWSLEKVKLGRHPTFILPLDKIVTDIDAAYKNLLARRTEAPELRSRIVALAKQHEDSIMIAAWASGLAGFDRLYYMMNYCPNPSAFFYDMEDLIASIDNIARSQGRQRASEIVDSMENYFSCACLITDALREDAGMDEMLIELCDCYSIYDTLFAHHPVTFDSFSKLARRSYPGEADYYSSPIRIEDVISSGQTWSSSGGIQLFRMIVRSINALPPRERAAFLDSLRDLYLTLLQIVHDYHYQLDSPHEKECHSHSHQGIPVLCELAESSLKAALEPPRGAFALLPHGIRASLNEDEVYIDIRRVSRTEIFHQPEIDLDHTEWAVLYGAVVVRGQRPIAWVPFCRAADFDVAAELFLRNYTRRHQPAIHASIDSWLDGYLHELYKVVFAKLAPHLKGASRIFWHGDGYFNLLPIDLVLARFGKADYPADVLFTQVASADALARPASDMRDAMAHGTVMIAGDAVYDGGDKVAANPAAPAGEVALRDAIAASYKDRNLSFGQLKGAAREMAEIRKLVVAKASKEPLFFSGESAEEGMIRRRLPDANVVHLATHGFYLDSSMVKPSDGKTRQSLDRIPSPMFRSGLAFANANQTIRNWCAGNVVGTDDDGILLAAELKQIDLHKTKLMVLSACSTAEGKPIHGGTVLGLRSALIDAGVETLVLTLWNIKDLFTVEFMERFYSECTSGGSASDALQRTKWYFFNKIADDPQGGLTKAVLTVGPYFSVTSAARTVTPAPDRNE